MALFEWLFRNSGSKFNTRDSWGISKNFYSIIGLIAAESARVEHLIGVLCILLTQSEAEAGQMLIANLGFRSRMDILWSIVDLKNRRELSNLTDEKFELFVQDIERVRLVLIQVEEAYPKRNVYVHGMYTAPYGINGAVMFSVRVKGKLAVKEQQVSPDEIYAVYLQIHDAREQVASLVRALDTKEVFHSKEPEERDPQSHAATQNRDPTLLAPAPPLHATVKEKAARPRRLSSAQKRALRENGESS